MTEEAAWKKVGNFWVYQIINDAELAVKEKIVDIFVASQPTPPQLSYPNTRQGAMQCFDDMTARGMRLDLIEYRYYPSQTKTLCKHCGQLLDYVHGVYTDPTGGDVCGYDGGNEPHEP